MSDLEIVKTKYVGRDPSGEGVNVADDYGVYRDGERLGRYMGYQNDEGTDWVDDHSTMFQVGGSRNYKIQYDPEG